MENDDGFDSRVHTGLSSRCKSFNGDDTGSCNKFSKSSDAFKWLLETENDYIMRRYGGISFNSTVYAVWFNNKGYHSMPAYLNELNSAILQNAVNNTDYSITTNNHPLKMGDKELTTSSM